MAKKAASVEPPTIKACCTVDAKHLYLPHGLLMAEAISLNGKLWTPGETIGFAFLDGGATQRKKAQKWIEYWLQVVNLKFDFNAGAGADVRITFATGGSWSYIGTDCRAASSGPTMQFGWVTDTSDDESDRAVIVHEAGHMLGLGHEQSSPWEDIKWDKPKALAYYMRTQGWSAQMVQDNVFDVYGTGEVKGTTYDRTSIMQYPVPAELTTDGRGIGWNTDLSALDRSYAAALYPGATAPTAPPIPPVTTPVKPPVTPPLHPVIVIGSPAVHQPIPAPGQPAQFTLDVPAPLVLELGAAIVPAYGRDPAIVVAKDGGDPLRLGLVRGKGLFKFQPGDYTVAVYNTYPRQTGTAWIKVTRP